MPAHDPDALDSLYEVLPAEFVKARNALAKSLKAAGHRDQADAVSKLPRPTASVWATNQVARRSPRLIQQLGEATERLQRGVPRERDQYANAITTHRDLLAELRTQVDETLHRAGLRVAPAVVAAAVQNFRAGLMDEATRPLLEKGRLQHDVGLDAGADVFGLSAAAAAGDHPPAIHVHQPPAKRPHNEHANADQKVRERELRERERAFAKARAEAERRVQTLRKALQAAEAAGAKRQAIADSARADLERAERALAAGRASEADAREALAAAESELRNLPAPSA